MQEFLRELAVPITLAIITLVFLVLTKALKEYVTKEVNKEVDELKAAFTTFARDFPKNVDTVMETRFGKMDATMQTSFGKVAEDVHSMSEMQQRLTQIAISHDAMIKELQKKG